MNENVIPFSYLRNLKTPTVVILLGFFFVLICDELCDEQVMNNLRRWSVYLGNSDEALIKLHKRIPNNFKVVK